jgi:hypothetical protein
MMEEDIYKQFRDRVKANPPQLQDKKHFANCVMGRIEEGSKKKAKLRYLINLAASIVILISISSYAWLEVSTYNSRLQLQGKTGELPDLPKAQWQCKQSIRWMMAELVKTRLINVSDNKIVLEKNNVDLLGRVDRELYDQLQKLILVLKDISPGQYYKYKSGEAIELSAWELRRDYQVCDWLID